MPLWVPPSGTSGTVSDATTSSKGIVQLAGDLAGTAASPTVPGLAGKAASTHSHAESDVTNLGTDLAAKAAIQETVNTQASVTGSYSLPDVTSATMHKLTLTGAATVTLPTPGAGKSLTVEINQDATGSRTLTLATPSGAIQWAGGTAPTWSTAASKRDVATFVCIGGTNWIGSALIDVR